MFILNNKMSLDRTYYFVILKLEHLSYPQVDPLQAQNGNF